MTTEEEEKACLGRLLIKIVNRRGPRMLAWNTPDVTGRTKEHEPSMLTTWD